MEGAVEDVAVVLLGQERLGPLENVFDGLTLILALMLQQATLLAILAVTFPDLRQPRPLLHQILPDEDLHRPWQSEIDTDQPLPDMLRLPHDPMGNVAESVADVL